MGTTEDLAEGLAADVLEVIEATGDLQLMEDMSNLLATQSSTMQEAFMTAIRVRMSEKRARKYLAERVGELQKKAAASAKAEAIARGEGAQSQT